MLMKNAINKILEINGIVKSLDPALQERASDVLLKMAFGNLIQETTRASASRKHAQKIGIKRSDAIAKRPAFFNGHEHDRLKDNVHLIVAWLYSRYGLFPVETKLVRETAERMGLLIPNRPDNTMRQAKCRGKSLYQHIGRGWQLTPLGERYVHQRYKVKRGRSAFNEEALFSKSLEDCQPNKEDVDKVELEPSIAKA